MSTFAAHCRHPQLRMWPNLKLSLFEVLHQFFEGVAVNVLAQDVDVFAPMPAQSLVSVWVTVFGVRAYEDIVK